MEPLKVAPHPLSIAPQPVAAESAPAAITVKEESKEGARKPAQPEPQHPPTSEQQTREVPGTSEDKKREPAVVDPPQKGITVNPTQTVPTQPISTYKKMMDLFATQTTSDTDDDVVAPTKPPTTSILDNPVSKAPTKPTTQHSSAGMLSQYLAAASKPKDTSPSDSDDDFFK
ncbi:hypothetical protein ANCDUO_16581 [Ancylostoma duodenale]|uniref:Uncharacterized protein n=1 Tax=Ancylostoma duodenale TaxID=51022 RepID=A0A0C2G317_9BILA|nr:hypothetical protein ANCDUO_16581 [Ancylostoma duodenale]